MKRWRQVKRNAKHIPIANRPLRALPQISAALCRHIQTLRKHFQALPRHWRALPRPVGFGGFDRTSLGFLNHGLTGRLGSLPLPGKMENNIARRLLLEITGNHCAHRFFLLCAFPILSFVMLLVDLSLL